MRRRENPLEREWQEIVMEVEFDSDTHADLARSGMGLPPLYTKVKRVTWNEVCAIIVVVAVLWVVGILLSI
jgi:hypothetical protein